MIQDSLQPESSSATYTNKVTWWVILGIYFLLLFHSLLICYIAFTVLRRDGDYTLIPMLCMSALQFSILVLIFLQLINFIVRPLTSYLKVTPEGIENKVWLDKHIFVRWSDLERLGKYFRRDVVYFKTYEVLGPFQSHASPLKILSSAIPMISLSAYNSWPNGELESYLRKYAPHLFVGRPAVKQVQTPSPVPEKNISGTSQNQRLLAAFAHISVVYLGLGVFIPLIIYSTQKEKSSYLAVHALKAFFYQFIGTIACFMIPLWVIGPIVLEFILSAALGREETLLSLIPDAWLILVALAIPLALLSIVYVIYGVIAGVRAYRGQDFRYPIIGKRLEKMNPTSM